MEGLPSCSTSVMAMSSSDPECSSLVAVEEFPAENIVVSSSARRTAGDPL